MNFFCHLRLGFSFKESHINDVALPFRQAFHRSCDGVLSVETDSSDNLVSVEFDDKSVTPQMLRDCLTSLGYTVDRARMEYNL